MRRPLFPSAMLLSLAATPVAWAQYTPPPPLAPFPGYINQYLRNQDPYLANWDIGGSVRLRYEVRENALGIPPANDFKAGVANDNSYFSTKLLFRVAHTEKWWNITAEGRNSSATGDSRGSAPNIATGASPDSDGPVDLHQAFLTLGNHKEFPVSLKVGRQELSYGDERVIGAFGWNQIGRVFDAAKVRWQNAWFGVDGFTGRVVVPDDNNFNTSNPYEQFSGLYFNTQKLPKNWTEFYILARNVSPQSATLFAPAVTPVPFNTTARDIYTVGARFRSATNEWGNFDYTVETMGQFGSWKRPAAGVRPNERDEQRAYAFTGNLGYTFAESFGTPRLAVEYCYGSGDSNPNDGTHETFDNLYPTNHKFYGYQDLASLQNLSNLRLISTFKPHPRLSLALEGHLFWLANTSDRFYNVGGVARAGAGATGNAGSGTGYGLNSTYGSFVGSELDLVAGFALTKAATFEAGYSHFFHGDYIADTFKVSGSKDADWVYAQLLVRF